MKPSARKLSDEDRILWNRVARTAAPLKGKVAPPDEPPQPSFEEFLAQALAPAASPVKRPPEAAPPKQSSSRPHPFDGQTRDKLAKGKLDIGGTVDLHGMTQSEAHGLLLSFLQRAHASGMRYVLVITGKGASFGSEGVLKRAVPGWLATPPFRALVSSHDAAARHHGGGGALYVRLKRREGTAR
jgi:DNA-nicking Smr family endonuclease